LIWILQVAVKNTLRSKKLFASRPPEDLNIHKYTLRLHKIPWRDLRPSNVVLGTWGRRSSPDSGETDGGAGRGRVGMGPTFTYSSIMRFVWVRTKAGEGLGGTRLGQLRGALLRRGARRYSTTNEREGTYEA
jgi:hypothetical protein